MEYGKSSYQLFAVNRSSFFKVLSDQFIDEPHSVRTSPEISLSAIFYGSTIPGENYCLVQALFNY